MLIFLGPKIIDTHRIISIEKDGNHTIEFTFKNGLIKKLLFVNAAILDWVFVEIKISLEKERRIFDIDSFLTEKHLINAYKVDGSISFHVESNDILRKS